jgi:hypothetical protein
MNELISSQRLAELGVHGYEPGDVVELTLPTDQAGEARSLVAGLVAVYLASPFSAVPDLSHLPDRVGIHLELGSGRPSLVRLATTEPDDTLRVLPAHGGPVPEAALYVPPDEPGVLAIDLSRFPQVTVMSERGGVSVRLSGQRLTVQEIRFRIEPLATVTAPLGTWLELVTDQWLVDEAALLATRQNSWTTVVTAGLIARHVDAARGESAEAAWGRFLRGEADPLLAAPRRWARGLGGPEKRTISDLALAETDVLHRELEDVGASVHEGLEGWEAQWRRLCARRDDLESVRLVLHEANADEALSDALLDVDRAGEALRLSVPWSAAVADERAHRVGLLNPFAWWGTYAAGEPA